jgi:transposase-like protein/IS1 family transposase
LIVGLLLQKNKGETDMTCIRCKHQEATRFGFGRHKIQRFRCPSCKATFSEPRKRPLGRHYISTEKASEIITLLTEGMSIRAVSRITGVHKTTILSLLITVGDKCRRVFDARVRNVKTRFVQGDELWSYVHTKERQLGSDDPTEWGDAYTWIALDSETKLVLSYHVGKRDAESAFILARDLSERVTGRFQITTDGFKPYISAIEDCFGSEVDYAQLIKIYGRAKTEGPDWYAPTKVLDAIPVQVSGSPKIERISTSHVERMNLNVRMGLRRFTRLTNAFSKKLDNLKAAVSLYMAFYNFVRVHQTLRVTPAMQAGITDHIWTVQELLEAA